MCDNIGTAFFSEYLESQVCGHWLNYREMTQQDGLSEVFLDYHFLDPH